MNDILICLKDLSSLIQALSGILILFATITMALEEAPP